MVGERVWIDDERLPTKPGFYPVVLCWDPFEGLITSARYWDGKAWPAGSPVTMWIDEAFEKEEHAGDLAFYHDPEQ
jgi:hypothetical protein